MKIYNQWGYYFLGILETGYSPRFLHIFDNLNFYLIYKNEIIPLHYIIWKVWRFLCIKKIKKETEYNYKKEGLNYEK